MTTPKIGAPDWSAAQATPWTTENKAKRMIEAMARAGTVEDRNLTAPPGSCADGACYLIAATATGLWATHDGEMAIAVGTNAASGWYFVDVEEEGVQLYVKDENARIEWNGSAWVTFGSVGTPFEMIVALSDETTAIEAGTGKLKFRMPVGVTLTKVKASLNTPSASSGSEVIVDLKEGGVSIFSTLLSIDVGATTSEGATVPAVISDSSLAADAEMSGDIIVAGDGATGLKLTLIGTRS